MIETIGTKEVISETTWFIIPAVGSTTHRESFCKKDAGQASMTDRGI